MSIFAEIFQAKKWKKLVKILIFGLSVFYGGCSISGSREKVTAELDQVALTEKILTDYQQEQLAEAWAKNTQFGKLAHERNERFVKKSFTNF